MGFLSDEELREAFWNWPGWPEFKCFSRAKVKPPPGKRLVVKTITKTTVDLVDGVEKKTTVTTVETYTEDV